MNYYISDEQAILTGVSPTNFINQNERYGSCKVHQLLAT